MTQASTPAAPPLRIQELVIRYPGKKEPSLDDISVDVAAGERVGVAGRTGAGKSTLGPGSRGVHPARRSREARRSGRDRRDRHRRGGGRRAARPGRDRVRDAGEPAVRLEADRARGARLRTREPRHPPNGDGRTHRRDARSPRHRPPRRPRAIRPVRVASSSASRSRASWRWGRPSSSSTSRPPSSIRPGRSRWPTSSRTWRSRVRRSCVRSTIRACSGGWIGRSYSTVAARSRSMPRGPRWPWPRTSPA